MFENYDNIFKNLQKEVVQTINDFVLEKVLKRWGWEIYNHSEDIYTGVLTDKVKVLKLTVSMFRS